MSLQVLALQVLGPVMGFVPELEFYRVDPVALDPGDCLLKTSSTALVAEMQRALDPCAWSAWGSVFVPAVAHLTLLPLAGLEVPAAAAAAAADSPGAPLPRLRNRA